MLGESMNDTVLSVYEVTRKYLKNYRINGVLLKGLLAPNINSAPPRETLRGFSRDLQVKMRSIYLLRALSGDANLFAERTGLALNQIGKQLDLAERKGMLYRDHALIRPTPLGRRFLNDLQEIFLSG